MYRLLTLLLLTNFIYSIEITNLHNPFLPINLGKAKLIYNNHIFLHYLNYDSIKSQINLIKENINLTKTCYAQISDPNPDIKLTSIPINLETLQFYLNKVTEKYENLNPHINSRTKRGLLNPIGTIYKAAFGLLDSDDGDKLYKAIDILDKNQKNIHNSLDKQISLSKKLIERLNTSLTNISNNQQQLANKLKMLQNQHNIHFINSIRLIGLQDVVRQISTNCLLLIEQLDTIENAIMFARLQTTHPSIIKTNEIQEMISILTQHYHSKNIISFKSILSYYKVLTTQVFFENERIMFVINFPIIQLDEFKLFQIIPIPQNNILYYPTMPFMLTTPEKNLMLQNTCHEIESTNYCEDKAYQADDCMETTLKTTDPVACKTRRITLKTTLTQRIDSNVILVPQLNEKLITRCDQQEQVFKLKNPVLIKLPPKCDIEINGFQFSNSRSIKNIVPLILPKVQTLQTPRLPQYQPIELRDPELEKIQDLKHLIQHTDPLIPIDVETHSYTGLITLIIILIILFVSYFWYNQLCYFKKKPRILGNTSKEEEGQELQQKHLFSLPSTPK